MTKEIINIEYSEKHIKDLTGPEHVRLRYNAYIEDRGLHGLWHILSEALDNSVDELALKPKDGLLTVVLFYDRSTGSHQMLVRDNGRGIPAGSLESVYTKLQSSGKFDNESYQFSGGSFGVGACVITGLSKHFKAICFNNNRAGLLYVNDTKIITSESHDYPRENTGSVCIYEPMKARYEGEGNVKEFILQKITDLYTVINTFVDFNIEFHYSSNPLPKDIWTMGLDDTVNILENITDLECLFTTKDLTKDPKKFAMDYFGINKYQWTHTIDQDVYSETNLKRDTGRDLIKYHIDLYISRDCPITDHVSIGNYVFLSDKKSDHTTVLHRVLKKHMSRYIKDKGIKEYFTKTYDLPIVGLYFILYEQIKFSNLQKTAIRDDDFTKIYRKLLNSHFDNNVTEVQDLYQLLEKDILSKYNAANNVSLVVKDINKLQQDLVHPDKFKDCETTNRQEAELYISEGDSANSSIGRDAETQASYCVRGVGLNPLSKTNDLNQAYKLIAKNKIDADIIKITGLTRDMTDFSKLRYGKIFINVDADAAGAHIARLLFATFWTINPNIIRAGIVQLVSTPLYQITFNKGAKGQGKRKIFKKTTDEVIAAITEYAFYKTFTIKIQSKYGISDPLTKKEFVDLALIIYHIGGLIDDICEEHRIESRLLELLLPIIQDTRNMRFLSTERVKKVLGTEAVQYDPLNQVLTVSINKADKVIGLRDVKDSLRDVYAILNRIAYRKHTMLVSTNYTDLYKDTPISIINLWEMFKTLQKDLFEIDRKKGLGSLLPEDRAMLSMNPIYRVVTDINQVGDEERILQLMGKESKYRGELLLSGEQ